MDGHFDRISCLPDDVLTHILSFLSAKEVVQTCILSKRWRHVWAAVPVLKFFSHEFWAYDTDDEIEVDWRFDRFVNTVFENRGQSRLDTLIYDGKFENSSSEPSMEWLDRAVLLRPEVIKIDIRGPYQLNFPDSVFSCESLQSLELFISTNRDSINLPKSITLPSLKSMKLYFLSLDDDFARNLFLGCPSLESLKLAHCDLSIPEISSKMLKKLTLNECLLFEHMQICCPSLVSLFMKSWKNSIRIISLVNMASLVNADIRLYGTDEEVGVDDLPDLSILSGLSNVTSLKLSNYNPDLKEQWEKDIPNCRIFKNLTSLIIKSRHIINDFNLVACILEHSPDLRKFTLDLRHNSIADAQEQPRQHVILQLGYLETIKICGRDGELVSKLINLLGRHFKAIGNVIITC